jgi:biopolymer transport protein ExbD
MKFPRHYSMQKGELNITPLVDVIFLLLIYFMLTSSFIMQPGIKIKLPEAATTEKVEKEEIVVSVSEEGVIFYQDRPVTIEFLAEILSRKVRNRKDLTLVIKGDKGAMHGRIVSVMDKARKAGVNKIAIATMPEIK